MAAMIGFQHSKSRVMPPKGARRCSFGTPPPLPAIISDIATRSLPVEKARSPAPVMIATHSSASSRKSQKAEFSSKLVRASIALRRSGRLIVIMAIRPSFS